MINIGGRYYVTGTQIGILLSPASKEDKERLLKLILDRQFIGNKGDFEEAIKDWKMKKSIEKTSDIQEDFDNQREDEDEQERYGGL